MPKKQSSANELEVQYAEIFRNGIARLPLPENTSLEQPSPLVFVPSVVAYGAHEQPILGRVGDAENA
jgi:hypothetical protein